MDVLERIRNLRLERNWTEYQLAEKSGIPQSTISTWFRKQNLPTISSLEKICYAFDITLSDFFREDEYNNLDENQIKLIRNFHKLNKAQQESLLVFLEQL